MEVVLEARLKHPLDYPSSGGDCARPSLLLTYGSSEQEGKCPPPLTQSGKIKTISADGKTVVLELPTDGQVKTFSSGSVGSTLTNLGPNDTICFSASGDPQQTQPLDVIAPAQGTVNPMRAGAP
jgi:hypothetical protein